jgi:hypothetical protein
MPAERQTLGREQSVMTTISWSLIEAECGNFRDGFVATFRKYEGAPTDEKDAQGRTIKVTAKSFAEHMGVAPRTFQTWVKNAAMAPQPITTTRERRREDARRAIRHDPDAVIDAIMEAPEQTQDRIFHEVKLRRAGEDRSPASRKAAAAHTDDMLEPATKALGKMASGVIGMAETIEEVADDLDKAILDGYNLDDVLPRLREATDRLMLAIERATMMSEARR